jgi:carbamoylphosphate synthase large subunit
MKRMNHQIIQFIATAGLVAIAGAILASGPAMALNQQFEEAWQKNLNALHKRFEEARRENLNALSDRFEEAREQRLNS